MKGSNYHVHPYISNDNQNTHRYLQNLKGPRAYPAASHQPLLPPRCDRVSGRGEGDPGLPEAHLRGQGLPAAKGPSWRALLHQGEATQIHR